MIIIDQFFGNTLINSSLGNHIIQLRNIIDIAIAYKHNIKINVKKLNFFDLSVIEKYFNKYNNNEIITDKYNFFYNNKLPFSKNIFKQNIEERNKILQNSLELIDN